MTSLFCPATTLEIGDPSRMIRVLNHVSLECETRGSSVPWMDSFEAQKQDPVSGVKFSESESLESDLDLASLLSSATLDDTNSAQLTTPTTHSTHESVTSALRSPSSVSETLLQQSPYAGQERFLQFVEPVPVHPPQYSTLPPGGCPRFPVLEIVTQTENLPTYSPAAYKIGLVARKIEWVSPFQPASSRSWKNVIIELNSTQVNFYRIPSHLESYLMNFSRFGEQPCESRDFDKEVIDSQFTTIKDKSFYSLCSRVGILSELQDKNENLSKTMGKHQKFDFKLRLLRSYSLLHAKVGLASDYGKKPNVLRLRLENEQLLLHFSLARDLIEWHLGLSVGQDVAADILERETPKYRTVPRRRRGQSYRLSGAQGSSLTRGRRGRSSSMPIATNGFRSTLFNVKQRIRSNSLIDSEEIAPLTQVSNSASNNCKLPPDCQCRSIGSSDTRSQPAYDENEDVQTLSDLNHSDEDDEEDVDNVEDIERVEEPDGVQGVDSLDSVDSVGRAHAVCGNDKINAVNRDTNIDDDDDEDDRELLQFSEATQSRIPAEKSRDGDRASLCEKYSKNFEGYESERKFLKNCIKCIKPLCFDEPWTNRTLVKATFLSPVDIREIGNQVGVGRKSWDSEERWNTNFLRKPSTSCQNPSRSKRRISFTKQHSACHSTAVCTPNHNLREYVVGSHLLVPREI